MIRRLKSRLRITKRICLQSLDLNGDNKIGVTANSTAKDRANYYVNATVEFDLDADGHLDHIEMLSGDGDGLLIDNCDGNDQGDLYANGFEKLALLDANHDGVLKGEDLNGLELWVDDGDVIAEAVKLQDLAHNRIYSINVEMKE